MKIILTADVKSLGKKGEVKEVAEGYARNFLLPKKMAITATDAAIKNIDAQKKKEMQEQQASTEKLKKLAGTLKGSEVVLKSKEKGGKLFGSITKKDIVRSLEEKGVKVAESSILLHDPIKNTGVYEIEIRLASEISSKIKIKVESL